MVDLVIAGGGGFGWELAEYIRQDIATGKLPEVRLRGVIDDNIEAAHRAPIRLPYLGTISDYQPLDDDAIILALGTPRSRRVVHDRLVKLGAKFFSYIHSSAYVALDARLGEGVIVCPNCVINSGASLDEFAVVNVFGSVGHGAHIGAFSVLSPYAALNGDAVAGNDCFLGTRATIFPRVRLGNSCTVDTHSYVKSDVGDKKIITNRGNYLVLDNRL